MRKIVFYLFFTVLLLPAFSQQTQQLTTAQKINDFEYLYKTLKENYPYFGVLKRKHNVDWLAKKDEYLTRVKNAETDSAYIYTIESILRELKNGHMDILPTYYYDEMVKLYGSIVEEQPAYKTWMQALEDPLQRADYWAGILKYNVAGEATNMSAPKNKPANYTDTIIAGKRIAIMRINSFDLAHIEQDRPLIDSFLCRLKDTKQLIIDIQKNGGGATAYWEKNIVSRLTKDTIFYSPYCFIKDGEINRKFYPESFQDASLVQLTDQLTNIPEELLDGSYYMKTQTDTIIPDRPVTFEGEVFLLTSRRVYSSSEGFAHFCKSTGWATVAGERTGGDGVGSDPVIFVLPESGILVRCPSLTGFNADGSMNFEERTIPDLPIEADTFDERLEKLIEYVYVN